MQLQIFWKYVAVLMKIENNIFLFYMNVSQYTVPA